MKYKDDITKVIEDIVALLDKTVKIKTVVDNGDGTFDLTVCDMKWAQPSFAVTISGNDYTIEKIDDINKVITVKGSPQPPVVTFDLYEVKYFHGTIKQTQQEITEIVEAKDKTPMVFFYEIFRETFFENFDDVRERQSDLRLFILTQGDFTKWQTKDFYANALKPMRRLTEMLIELFKASKRVNEIINFTTVNHTRFGVYIDNKGYEKILWVDKLTGVELRIVLELIKDGTCEPVC